ncbi:MAG: hypothetical protein JW795_03320 [Chitinivibrionales bacterium]|nr:hypothetical protein [Chitinivibrionales bacterium]
MEKPIITELEFLKQLSSKEYMKLFDIIDERIKYLETVEMFRCPTCGSSCHLYSSDEGTNSFVPLANYDEYMKLRNYAKL